MSTRYVGPWVLYAIAVAALLSMLMTVTLNVIGYLADEYAKPSWNEQSVPRPRMY
jgi:hypothetical protein